jgi:hypothetical protein
VKKKTLQFLTVMVLSASLVACGSSSGSSDSASGTEASEAVADVSTEAETETEEEEEVEIRDGMYRSELTNEWISVDLMDQRPIAVMVDNELTALPHYGLTEADVVYEMMNSTANGRITRLMALVKDWETITQFGSIRSVRPTNFLLAAEWNAIICHDGGPFYIDEYAALPYSNNVSGGFSRVDNGKSREFTEYICTGDLDSRISDYGYSTTYNEYYTGAHYKFADEDNPVDLSSDASSTAANKISLPFPHNKSTLTYDADSETYLYSEYGEAHVDPLHDNAQLAFKNVLLQSADFTQYDEHGYMIYDVVSSGEGYYITDGTAIKVTWKKTSNTEATRYYNEEGNEIKINTGKTYIGIVPSDSWSDLEIE